MKKIQTFFLLLPALLLSNCYTGQISYNNMDRIQRGMSPPPPLPRGNPSRSHDVETQKEKKEDKSTEKETSTKVRVATDGKHEIVVSDAGGLIITASGELIHAF